jgi:transposase
MYTYFIKVGHQMISNVLQVSSQFINSLTQGALSLPPVTDSVLEKKETIIELSERHHSLLEGIVRRTKAAQSLVIRVKIILYLWLGYTVSEVARLLGIVRKTVRKWRERWNKEIARVKEVETDKQCSDKKVSTLLENVLSDAYRSGAPSKFTAEQIVQIIALACENIEKYGLPLSHWTSKALSEEAIRRGIVENISPSTVRRLLKEARIKPHLSRYWLNAEPEDEEQFKKEVKQVCQLYRMALDLHKQGIHVVSTDEKTGIQALERICPCKGVKPGLVERIEHSYERHGTICLIGNFEVATGRILAATLNPTRTEEDFLNHIIQTVSTDCHGHWIFIVDNLNTHMSASLVQWVAKQCNITTDLGIKEKKGILKSMKTRAAFLSDTTHRIRFVYTPKHTSWLNQIETWFSILVRRLLKRSSFKSVEDLRERIINFIDYFNKVMAKPFKWTYEGKPLTV